MLVSLWYCFSFFFKMKRLFWSLRPGLAVPWTPSDFCATEALYSHFVSPARAVPACSRGLQYSSWARAAMECFAQQLCRVCPLSEPMNLWAELDRQQALGKHADRQAILQNGTLANWPAAVLRYNSPCPVLPT